MQSNDQSGTEIHTQQKFSEPEKNLRRDLLHKTIKVATGGVLAPSLMMPIIFGASGPAKARDNWFGPPPKTPRGYFRRMEGVNEGVIIQKISSSKFYVFGSRSGFLGMVTKSGDIVSIVPWVGNGKSIEIGSATRRRLQDRSRINYPVGYTGVVNALRCAESFFAIANLVGTSAKIAIIKIIDSLTNEWETVQLDLENKEQYDLYQDYIKYMTEAATKERTVSSGMGVTGAILTIACVLAATATLPVALTAVAAGAAAGAGTYIAIAGLRGPYASLQAWSSRAQRVARPPNPVR